MVSGLINPRWLLAASLALSASGGSALAVPWDGGTPRGGPPKFALNAQTAAPTKLELGGQGIPLTGLGGGFVITDYNAKKDVSLSGGHVQATGAVQTYRAEGSDLVISATFTPQNGFIAVQGEIVNKVGNDRPVILRYILPVPAKGATFESEISKSEVVADKTQGLGTVFPLGAMTGTNWGVALAIPPTAPCCFGMTGSVNGLGVEFYFGLSPKPQKFPNAAPFSFVIYPAIPGWGFRSALAQYYQNNPQYYDAPFQGSGFYLWAEKGNVDYALPLFRLVGVPRHLRGTDYSLYTDRAKKGKLITIEYIGATVRGIEDLPKLPDGYDATMKAWEDFKVAWNKMTDEERLKKFSPYRYRDFINAVEHSVIMEADGKYSVAGRDTSFSPNEVIFMMNPNPWLFADKGWTTVGSGMVKYGTEFMKTDPIDGITVDSLGGNFPARLNYRPDHFVYEQYPLTFDRQGRVAIHNMISHYELMAALRTAAHAVGKYTRANGIYRYDRDASREENYNGQDNGRFFIGAVLDLGSRELSKVMTRDQFEFGRVAMGRKLYLGAYHRWDNPEDVRVQMNRALAYTQFCLPAGTKSYLTDKNGYFRDKDLLEWFIKYARLMTAAGWQPLSWATTDHPDDVGCERYGSGDKNYFALVNFADYAIATKVSLDLGALGLKGKPVKVTEIAQNAPITQTTDGNTCHVEIKLDPSKTCILQLIPAKP